MPLCQYIIPVRKYNIPYGNLIMLDKEAKPDKFFALRFNLMATLYTPKAWW